MATRSGGPRARFNKARPARAGTGSIPRGRAKGPTQLDPVCEGRARSAANVPHAPRPGPCGPGHVEPGRWPLTFPGCGNPGPHGPGFVQPGRWPLCETLLIVILIVLVIEKSSRLRLRARLRLGKESLPSNFDPVVGPEFLPRRILRFDGARDIRICDPYSEISSLN